MWGFIFTLLWIFLMLYSFFKSDPIEVKDDLLLETKEPEIVTEYQVVTHARKTHFCERMCKNCGCKQDSLNKRLNEESYCAKCKWWLCDKCSGEICRECKRKEQKD